MRDSCSSSPKVVIGIDGSRSAIRAALWAIDEAVQLLVVDPRRVDDLVEPAGLAALDATRCSLLISGRQCWL